MGIRLPYTPNSRIRACLRQLFLRSRERAKAIKRDKYTCQICGKKQSKAKGREQKVEVHHKTGIDWNGVCDLIRIKVLQKTEDLETLCIDCHKKKGM